MALRDFPDDATAQHVAAAVGDLDTVHILVEGGADVAGVGDDHEVAVLGWALFFDRPDFAQLFRERGGV